MQGLYNHLPSPAAMPQVKPLFLLFPAWLPPSLHPSTAPPPRHHPSPGLQPHAESLGEFRVHATPLGELSQHSIPHAITPGDFPSLPAKSHPPKALPLHLNPTAPGHAAVHSTSPSGHTAGMVPAKGHAADLLTSPSGNSDAALHLSSPSDSTAAITASLRDSTANATPSPASFNTGQLTPPPHPIYPFSPQTSTPPNPLLSNPHINCDTQMVTRPTNPTPNPSKMPSSPLEQAQMLSSSSYNSDTS